MSEFVPFDPNDERFKLEPKPGSGEEAEVSKEVEGEADLDQSHAEELGAGGEQQEDRREADSKNYSFENGVLHGEAAPPQTAQRIVNEPGGMLGGQPNPYAESPKPTANSTGVIGAPTESSLPNQRWTGGVIGEQGAAPTRKVGPNTPGGIIGN
ncbi:MAG TPA: hypothetical protein VLA77_04690 [Candidatus Saccharimonadales bacterium]|nr:hypothetical protein [Candidatus Saccharimonadales bacterium]